MTAHRFDVACNGGAAAWIDIAAELRNAAGNRVWIENGQLNLLMARPDAADAQTECHRREAQAAASGRDVVIEGNCLPWVRKAALDHLVLPAGSAPVDELGARLTYATSPTPQFAPVYAALLSPVAMTTQSRTRETTVAVIDPEAMRTAGTRMQAWDTVLQPEYGQDDWVTVVHSGAAENAPGHVEVNVAQSAGLEAADNAVVGAEQATDATVRGWGGLWLVVFSAFGVAVIAALLMKLPPLAQRYAVRSTRLRLRRRSVSIANAATTISSLLEQTADAVTQLKGAGPLREVLLSEVQAVRERAAHVELAAGKGDVAPEKSGMQYRAMVRDLERIRRIVDSAVASLKKSGNTQSTLPQTASEAYDVLGVNAHVSAGVLKKIVDALRMSWHPDHARDDADREMREQRIRQINIAWDLINGERKAA
ncbi:J domain-containing protein [Hyphomicrobium sp. D-2]|uniref:J domain-containing protein n=1 Tax=Hyphomicrobium sp. D-2 TaxID=3041621 RepID=UPI002454B48A|nr:J domain-containing protein [Hyphomicrobium sp. D-2]MDH4982533.1 J domain-containing protein [Hyphomicrobium sp. D-2]